MRFILLLALIFISGDRPDDNDKWQAWTDGTKLIVQGVVEAGNPGVTIKIKPSVPQGINPKMLLLDCSLEQKPGYWAQVITPMKVAYTDDKYKGGYTFIKVNFPNGKFESIDKISPTPPKEAK